MPVLKLCLAMIMTVSLTVSCSNAPDQYDVVIINGMVVDGSGAPAYPADIAIEKDKIVKIGALGTYEAGDVIDAEGKYVTPGFINVLSWAPVSLLEDGGGMSDLLQGVTLEIFGEGTSLGPLNPEGKAQMMTMVGSHTDGKTWSTLAEYLDLLVAKGVSPNVASFVGATTIRRYVLGEADRAPNAAELAKMKDLVRQAMEEGALGLGSALIYPPAFFAKTDELIELAKVVSEYNGSYISHMRSEGAKIEEAVDELITIADQAKVHAEIYHLKFSGADNWGKFDSVIQRIETARKNNIKVTANIYPYIAGGTSLTATIPPWAQDGGFEALLQRLKNPDMRAKIKSEMMEKTDQWENFFTALGPENIMLDGVQNSIHKPLIGKTIAEISQERGTDPADTILDMIIEDNSEMEAIYFMMTEENIARKLRLPWVSVGSDAPALNPVGEILEKAEHPRAYGTFARVLGKYVRDEKVISLEEAIRRLTSLPAENFKLRQRGRLAENYYADIAIFDLAAIKDYATFEASHKLSVGMSEVLVNGKRVVQGGQHTGAKPGQVIRGPGWKP